MGSWYIVGWLQGKGVTGKPNVVSDHVRTTYDVCMHAIERRYILTGNYRVFLLWIVWTMIVRSKDLLLNWSSLPTESFLFPFEFMEIIPRLRVFRFRSVWLFYCVLFH